jgi:hypothetical protein
MDIFSLDTKAAANEGAVLELRDSVGKPLLKPDGNPVTITLRGADSDVYTAASNQLTNRAVRNRSKGIFATAEMLQADTIELLTKCIVAWDGLTHRPTPESEPVPFVFNEANAKTLLRVNYVREQVEQFVNDRGNYSKASPAS